MEFHVGDRTNTDAGRAYSIYINGKAPLNGGGANGVPLGTRIGMVGLRHDAVNGWYATPVDWNPLHDAPGVRHGFKSRKEACTWLLGVHDARQKWMQDSLSL